MTLERMVMMEKDISIKDVLDEDDQNFRAKKYNEYVKKVTPKHSWSRNLWRAFYTGGIVCTIGQALTSWYMNMGNDEKTAGMYTTLSLVLLSVILTGFGIFSKIAKYAGAGVLVPITGFANSVASPAIEFKKEGQIFGIGCKIFTIAGPVILYGIFTSWVLGVIYWLLTLCGVV